jgi:hypothetical protein
MIFEFLWFFPIPPGKYRDNALVLKYEQFSSCSFFNNTVITSNHMAARGMMIGDLKVWKKVIVAWFEVLH